MEHDLTRGNVLKTIAVFALPYMLSYFLQMLYGMADLYMMGQFSGAAGITAVGNGAQTLYIITVTLVGLAMGTTVIVGHAVGSRRFDRAETVIGNTITLFMGVSVVLAAILLALCPQIVALIGTPAEAVEGTAAYLRICFVGIPFIAAYNILSAIFRGLGDSRSPMYVIGVSCIINIALEGIMVIGGLAGVIAIQMMPAGSGAAMIVLVSILAAAIAGMVYAALLAFASINLNADQTIGGTALNMLATALAMVIAKGVNGSASAKLDYSNRAFVFDIGPLTVNVFLFVGIAILLLSYFVLYKTRLGLRLRACGEHPQAADSVGINVYKMRYIGVLISGVLGGIGGMAYIIPSVSSWNFEVGVSGAGFLALAVMIFGQWKPFRIFFAAVFFAMFKSLANIASSIPMLASLGWTQNMYNMIPFIASMIILAFTSKKSRAPKAEGIPYDKGSR